MCVSVWCLLHAIPVCSDHDQDINHMIHLSVPGSVECGVWSVRSARVRVKVHTYQHFHNHYM